MKIHFLGGSDEVGASCILLELGGQRILVDAGIRVSPKARDGLSGELLPDLSPLNDGKLDAVIPPEDAAQIQNAFFEQTAWNMKIKLAETQ